MSAINRGSRGRQRSRAKAGGVAGATQQALHLARPILFLDFDQRLQFAQVVGVAKRMRHALHRIVGLPVIVDDDADDIGQHLAALGASAIERQQGGAGDMQPLRLAADAEAGFVHMFDRRFGDEVAQRFGEAAQTPRAIAAHGGDRAGGELHAEQIGH